MNVCLEPALVVLQDVFCLRPGQSLLLKRPPLPQIVALVPTLAGVLGPRLSVEIRWVRRMTTEATSLNVVDDGVIRRLPSAIA